VEAVLQKNLDIKKASARILEIRSQLVQTRADRFPWLNFQGQAQRQRQTIEVGLLTLQGITQEQRRTTIDSHNLSLPASLEVDLWGRLAREKDTSFSPGPGRSDPGHPFKMCKYRPSQKPDQSD
jgi:outer membrane protein TolC